MPASADSCEHDGQPASHACPQGFGHHLIDRPCSTRSASDRSRRRVYFRIRPARNAPRRQRGAQGQALKGGLRQPTQGASPSSEQKARKRKATAYSFSKLRRPGSPATHQSRGGRRTLETGSNRDEHGLDSIQAGPPCRHCRLTSPSVVYRRLTVGSQWYEGLRSSWRSGDANIQMPELRNYARNARRRCGLPLSRLPDRCSASQMHSMLQCCESLWPRDRWGCTRATLSQLPPQDGRVKATASCHKC